MEHIVFKILQHFESLAVCNVVENQFKINIKLFQWQTDGGVPICRSSRWYSIIQDKTRNNTYRGQREWRRVPKKITGRWLNWYGHVMRRDKEHILRKVLTTDIPGKWKRGRPKTRRQDACQRDMISTGMRAGEEIDRATWRRKIILATIGYRKGKRKRDNDVRKLRLVTKLMMYVKLRCRWPHWP